MRTPILAANWKMHMGMAEAERFAASLLPLVADLDDVEIVVAPPYPSLQALGLALQGSRVQLAAQNVHDQDHGAFTGEVSASMLAELGCRYAIVGHSERRHIFGEGDGFVAKKAAALLDRNIRPIVCVGETLDQREDGSTFEVVENQLEGSLEEIPVERAAEVVLAYEPVWAIGTGRTATPEMAQEVHGRIREYLTKRFGAAGDAIRIQYGGSVKPDNAAALMAQPDIDGALVGGASLEADSFSRILHYRDAEGRE